VGLPTINDERPLLFYLRYMRKSFTFNEVLKGDIDAVNYNSTRCNLLDIVDALNQIHGLPGIVFLIYHDIHVRSIIISIRSE